MTHPMRYYMIALCLATLALAIVVGMHRTVATQTSVSHSLACRSDQYSYVKSQQATIHCGWQISGEAEHIRNHDSSIEITIVDLATYGEAGRHIIHRATFDIAQAAIEFQITIDDRFKQGGAYAIRATIGGQSPHSDKEAQPFFFRVLGADTVSVFSIDTQTAHGVDILTLNAGLSAEYAVQKSLGVLTGTLTHSWPTSRRGHGPLPVLGSANFLQDSIRATIAAYEDIAGDKQSYEHVIIATGFPSIPYIAQALHAPVLPIHFLVSIDSVREVEIILAEAHKRGYKAYATLGHDPSIDKAVAWIKLLDLPPEYADFIRRTRAQHVLALGSTGVADGETKARKLIRDGASHDIDEIAYRAGDIYIMYPGTSHSDEESLAAKIVDLHIYQQSTDFVRITDWESGVAETQLCSLRAAIADMDMHTAAFHSITAEDLIHLYDFGTIATAALMGKNRHLYSDSNKVAPKVAQGVVLNPYLMSYPSYEFREGWIPLVYFQVVPASATLDRIDRIVKPAIADYLPDLAERELKVWINSSRNFGNDFFGKPYEQELARRGFDNIRVNDYTIDEAWNLADDDISISEHLHRQEVALPKQQRLPAWSQKRQPLTHAELTRIVEAHPYLTLNAMRCPRR